MMKTILLGVLALTPSFAGAAEAKQIFRVHAQWLSNADGADCDKPASVLQVDSTEADVNVLAFVYQVATGFCGRPGEVPTFQIFSGSGTVSLTGNQTKISVVGTLPLGGGGEVDVDLFLRKTGNLPDGAGQKTVSAVATGTIILNGQDLTAGQPSTFASIVKSTN
jgi:hypothetical protein